MRRPPGGKDSSGRRRATSRGDGLREDGGVVGEEDVKEVRSTLVG